MALFNKYYYFLLVLVAITISSCDIYKELEPTEYLLKKNKIYLNDKKVRNNSLNDLLKQQPNQRFLGFPIGLYRYRLGNPSYDTIMKQKIERDDFRNRFFSKKQVYKFMLMKKHINEKLLQTPPVILDSLKTQQTTRSLSKHFLEKGFFTHTVTQDVKLKKQTAKVSYFITTGESFIVNKVHLKTDNTRANSILEESEPELIIQEGDVLDLKLLGKERDQLFDILRNEGFFNLTLQDIRFSIDTTIGSGLTDLYLSLNREKLTAYNIGTTNVFMSPTTQKDSLFKMTRNNLNFFSPKAKPDYKLRPLSKLIHITPGEPFSIKDKEMTYLSIKNSKNFNPTTINYTLDSTKTNSLIADIYLNPKKKYAINIGLEGLRSNTQNLGINLSYSFLIRNAFKRVSTLEYYIATNLGRTVDNDENNLLNSVTLDSYVRFFLPNPKIFSRFGKQDKYLSVYLGGNTRRNIGLDNIGMYTSLNYKWSAKNINHSINFIKLQYVRNTNPSEFFSVYTRTFNTLNSIANQHFANDAIFDGNQQLTDPDNFITQALADENFASSAPSDFNTVKDIQSQKARITADNLIFSSNYSINRTFKKPLSKNNARLNLNIELAGSLLRFIAPYLNFSENEQNKYELLEIPFSEYAKIDVNYTKHWWLSKKQSLHARSFIGLAVPFGNADNIPFIKSYFSGGPNDVRGWTAYSLGPGRSSEQLTFNEANFKLTTSIEYRLGITGKLNTALFIDAGNIWNVWDDVTNSDFTFNGFKSLSDIGLSTGTGLRYDISFLVIRIDMGLKIHDPTKRDEWLQTPKISDAVYHFAINYPF